MSGFAHEYRCPRRGPEDACARKVAADVGTVRVDVRSLLRKLRLAGSRAPDGVGPGRRRPALLMPLRYDELRRDCRRRVADLCEFRASKRTHRDLVRAVHRRASVPGPRRGPVREALRTGARTPF